MGSWLCLAGAFAAALSVYAQEQKPPENPYLALLEEARSAPVEVFADFGFGVLEKLPPAAQRFFFEESFRRAGEAREPVPVQYALSGTQAGRREVLRLARGRALDTLSLRCRAVLGLLPRHPGLARQLFEEIPTPKIPRTGCESEFVSDAGIYIRTLAAVAAVKAAFTPEEHAKQVPWQLVERAAYSISSSWEIVSAAKELPRFAHTAKQAAILASALATALAISDSDRTFASAAHDGRTVEVVLAAAGKLAPAGGFESGILAALRGYLVRHLSGTRCEDLMTVPPGGWTPKTLPVLGMWVSMFEHIDSFDRAVRDRSDIPPIGAGNLKALLPAKLEGRAAPPEYANEAEYRELLAGIARLSSLSADERAAGAEVRFGEMLSKIDHLNGHDALELFHEKCQLLAKLAKAAGEAETGRAVLSARIALLEDSGPLQNAPAEWLVEMQALLSEPRTYVYVHTSPDVPSPRTFEHTGAEIVPSLAASRVSAVSMYGRLAALRQAGVKP